MNKAIDEQIRERYEVNEALHLFKKNSMDFAYCLIESINTSHGVDLTFTFDKGAAHSSNFGLL